MDSTDLEGKPYLTSHTIDLTAGSIGTKYQFHVTAVNDVGEVTSDPLEVMLLAVPQAPQDAPTQDFIYSRSNHHIHVLYNEVPGGFDDPEVISHYELWRDNGDGGDFEPLFESDEVEGLQFLDKNVVEGLTYRYIYRARNLNGWGEFSNIGYLTAAKVPSQPPQPEFISATDSEINIQLFAPLSSGGA